MAVYEVTCENEQIIAPRWENKIENIVHAIDVIQFAKRGLIVFSIVCICQPVM